MPKAKGAQPEKPKNRGGRPKFVYDAKTARQIMTLASWGMPQVQIATLFGITVNSMAKHYRNELDKGMARGNSKIAKTLFKKAMDGDISALIFLAKVRLHMSTVQKVDHTSSDKSMAPRAPVVNIQTSDLDRLEKICDKVEWRASEPAKSSQH
jgi:hypothetical protein